MDEKENDKNDYMEWIDNWIINGSSDEDEPKDLEIKRLGLMKGMLMDLQMMVEIIKLCLSRPWNNKEMEKMELMVREILDIILCYDYILVENMVKKEEQQKEEKEEEDDDEEDDEEDDEDYIPSQTETMSFSDDDEDEEEEEAT